jgi:hypothetical protein
MEFYNDNFSDYEDFSNSGFSSKKGKKNTKKKKGDDHENGFGNNKKRNKPKRGNKDYGDY